VFGYADPTLKYTDETARSQPEEHLLTVASHAETESVTARVPALPSGTRLLHIGIPKTGTTTLQRAAAYNRKELLARGVCYPGASMNHREAISALMARPLGWKNGDEQIPSIKTWNRIAAQVRKTSADRSLISHEFACESNDEQAQRFLDELGPQTHVVIALRGFADVLGSSWQQYIKSGYRKPYGVWLKAILGKRSALHTTPTFYQRNDQSAIVRRWTRLAGADRVTVVIADKSRPEQLVNAFEDLLDLPRGLLTMPSIGGYAANRTLSAAEAELLRRVNRVLRAEGFSWGRYSDLMRDGLVARMQEDRTPGPDEQRLVLPEWAARRALKQSRRYAAAVAAAGCRVIGDLSALTAPVQTVPRLQRPAEIPIDAAVAGIAGLLSAEDGRGAFFNRPPTGVQANKAGNPTLTTLYESRRGQDTTNALRSTRHLDARTIVAVAAYRSWANADSITKPYRRRVKKLVARTRKVVNRTRKRLRKTAT
jgi:hypothetical protein